MAEEQDKVIISEGILNQGNYGAYLITADNPKMELRIVGGCPSPDVAMESAKTALARGGLDEEDIKNTIFEYHKREPLEVYRQSNLLSPDELKTAITAYLDRTMSQLTKAKLLKVVLSVENVMFLFVCITVWILWTHSAFKVPDTELPLFGKLFAGKILDVATVAAWYPLIMLALHAALFGKVIRTNLQYDLLRRHVLALVITHGWRSLDFGRMYSSYLAKSEASWFLNIFDWIYDKDPSSLSNLRAAVLGDETRDADTPSVSTSFVNGSEEDKLRGVKDELEEMLARDIPNEFERRVHNLYYLDKDKDYSRFTICFDPLIYLISLNRVIYNTYVFLRNKGVSVDELNAPTDPYFVGRIVGPLLFWVTTGFRALLFIGPGIWCLVALGFSHSMFWVDACALVATLTLPNWWNYRVLVKKQGFLKGEPFGVYTVGALATNPLSLA